jgi:hypothetical protein
MQTLYQLLSEHKPHSVAHNTTQSKTTIQQDFLFKHETQYCWTVPIYCRDVWKLTGTNNMKQSGFFSKASTLIRIFIFLKHCFSYICEHSAYVFSTSSFSGWWKWIPKKVNLDNFAYLQLAVRIGTVAVYLHSVSTLELLEGEWSTLSSDFFIPRKRPRYPLNRRLNGSQFRPGRFWEGGNQLTGIRNPILQCTASCYIGYVTAVPMNMEEVYWNCQFYNINITYLIQLNCVCCTIAYFKTRKSAPLCVTQDTQCK